MFCSCWQEGKLQVSDSRCVARVGRKEQAQLWGTVVALVIVIAVLFYCCKTDNTCCNSDDNEPSLAERLGFRLVYYCTFLYLTMMMMI